LAAAATSVLGLALTGCTSAPGTTAATAPPAAVADPLTILITVAGGDVTPNGDKLDVRVGQQIVLEVTSDEDDEIHAHTDGNGFELEVKAGKPATGSFTLGSAGSYQVESHHLAKVIVVLSAR